MAAIKKINPLLYITDRDPVNEIAMSPSKWFATETLVIDIGDSVGRPSSAAILRSSILAMLLGDGWYINRVLQSADGGNWKSVSTTGFENTTTSEGDAHGDSYNSNDGESDNTSDSNNNSDSSGSSASSTSSSSDDFGNKGWSGGSFSNTAAGTSHATGKASSKSTGTARSDSYNHTNNTSGGKSSVKSEGPPFWYAYQKIELKRRHIQAEVVLGDMVAEYTKAYNEGRKLNDERYDEIVSLYAMMLSRTAAELNLIAIDEDVLKPLLDQIRKLLLESPDGWIAARRDEIMRKFDKLLEDARSRLITQGLYNGTIWVTTASGIERDREIALNALVPEKLELYTKCTDAAVRLAALQKDAMAPTEMRNNVFKWMLDFMERREDDYPGLDKLTGLAAELGYSSAGATGGPVR